MNELDKVIKWHALIHEKLTCSFFENRLMEYIVNLNSGIHKCRLYFYLIRISS